MQPRPIDDLSKLKVLKALYLEQTTAPLDGMWLSGFVPAARHVGLYDGDALVGYYCVNDEGFLLQFLMHPDASDAAGEAFDSIVAGDGEGAIRGAFASTAETSYFAHCLDTFASFEVHTLMYQHDGPAPKTAPLPLRPLRAADLPSAITFAVDAIGAPEGWLAGYYGGLIEREELFGLWEDDELVATGELRRNREVQQAYADLGVIVAKAHRGRGLATRILTHLTALTETSGLKSICSTERENVGARRAITRAGFRSRHRIVRFTPAC